MRVSLGGIVGDILQIRTLFLSSGTWNIKYCLKRTNLHFLRTGKQTYVSQLYKHIHLYHTIVVIKYREYNIKKYIILEEKT